MRAIRACIMISIMGLLVSCGPLEDKLIGDFVEGEFSTVDKMIKDFEGEDDSKPPLRGPVMKLPVPVRVSP